MENIMSDTIQCRKFMLTINNPAEKGYTHETIQNRLTSLKSLLYYCLSEEIGANEHTPHIHIFAIYKNAKLITTIKNKFPEAHIDVVKGLNSEVRDYIFKIGKWADTEKGTTTVPGTQEEYGELPPDSRSSKQDLGLLYELIKDGLSDYQILEAHPEYMFNLTQIQRCRQVVMLEVYREQDRELFVSYIWGATGTGKSRYVLDKYGRRNTFRITDYAHPFDTYEYEDVLVFEEFCSSLRIQDMLKYLDRYPLKLPARYTDKIACFTKVFIISNTPLEQQYVNIQREEPEVWRALLRRINEVRYYRSRDEISIYDSVEDYLNRDEPFEDITDIEQLQLPF